jgi:hypothetical protein
VPDPSDPLGDATETQAERSSAPDDPDTQGAKLHERGPGAHQEQADTDDQLREDDSAPGV